MIWRGFLLGLSTGVFCLGYCAPVLVPYVLAEARPRLGMSLGLAGQFLLGRLAAYALFTPWPRACPVLVCAASSKDKAPGCRQSLAS